MPSRRAWIDPYGVPVVTSPNAAPGRWGDCMHALTVPWVLFTRRREYDVAYFLMTGLQLATGVPMARFLGKRIVMKFSGSNEISKVPKTWLGRWEIRFLKWWAAHILVLNDGMVEESRQAGFDLQKVMWMPNPVDIHEFCPASPAEWGALRPALQLPEESKVVLFVGRLAPEKELASLIRGFARAREQTPEALLVLVGDGPERASLTTLVTQLGLTSSVRFAGRQPIEAVRQWLQASALFALVSSAEGFPCSLEEAMATALPSVVSDIPANLQLVQHDVHGLVATLKDEAAIGDALLALLNDPAKRQRLGAAARTTVADHYSTEKVVALYEDLFRSIPE
jgi:glycosyltransferase involved in cell wall biosynthesis